MEDVQQLHFCWKTAYKSVWVWTVQTAIRLLHTEWNPLRVSCIFQTLARSNSQTAGVWTRAVSSGYPTHQYEHWPSCFRSCNTSSSRKVWDGEGQINIKLILAAPVTHFNKGAQPVIAWINNTLHHTWGSLQHLNLRNSWQCTEHQLQSTIQGELHTL